MATTNYAKIRQDILDHLDELPERFGEGAFYDPKTCLMCFYGWLAQAVSGYHIKDMETTAALSIKVPGVWAVLDREYGGFDSGMVIEADRIIRAAGGHPKVVVEMMLDHLITRGN